MDNLIEVSDDLQTYKDRIKQVVPVVGTTHDMFNKEIFKDGALSGKMKRLIGIAVGVKSGSFSCTVRQTKTAVSLGATKEEVMEAVSVAIAMGGTSALEYGGRVVKTLEELGKW